MLKDKTIFFRLLYSVVLLFLFSGCATTNKSELSDPRDPYEHVNRKIFAFNMACDRAFFRPIAKVYDTVLPWQAKKGVHNFFSNIGDVTSAANEILQLNFPQAIADIARVVINTTIGFGGLFDVATHMGIEKDIQDFGLTLAHWGAKDSPYVVLPFLGSYTIRDAISLPVNYFFLSPWGYIRSPTWAWGLAGLYFVQRRAFLLSGDKVVEQAFDPYVFIRDAYLQRRDYLANEGKQAKVEKYVEEDGVVHRRSQTLKTSRILAD